MRSLARSQRIWIKGDVSSCHCRKLKLFNHRLFEFNIDNLMNIHGSRRVLLLGASGMLGNYLAKALPEHFATYSPTPRNRNTFTLPDNISELSTRLDLSNSKSLDALLE